MNIRRVLGCLALALLAGLLVAPAHAARLVSMSSRIDHGRQSFDLSLPIDQSGIEPRTTRRGVTLVLQYDRPLTADVQVKLADGRARVGKVSIDGNTLLVPISGLADRQQIKLTVSGAGDDSATREISLRTLQGDVNGDARVDTADLRLVQEQADQPITNGNARFDVAASGKIDAEDARRLRQLFGQDVAGPAVVNTAPAISSIPNQESIAGRLPPGIGFQIRDAETPASQLMVWAASEDTSILPHKNIAISGTGAMRVLTAQPTAGRIGPVTIAVTVFDGLLRATTKFQYNFGGTPTLYIAHMTPQGGAQTQASGDSTLLLAADELSAIFRFDYTNLTGPETALHVHGPGAPGVSAGILFDIDTATPNADGSYTWTFEPVGGHSVLDQVNYIKQGLTYINVHTAAYPNGEIRGQFNLATGSQTFTPPAPPPSLPTSPPTAEEAARFLTQATFGPNESEIFRVMAMGYEAWIEEQFDKPQSKLLDLILQRQAQGEIPNNDNMVTESWWRYVLTGEDQLRQRVAFALSQIHVISQNDGDLAQRPREVAFYYDMLGRDAFGNFRTLLEDVTLNPQMGNYLDMRDNKKALGTQIPNENYAREILQLFSIGLYALHPDGSLKLGIDGLPIATYGQAEVTGFSRVFTGWDYHQAAQANNPAPDQFNPMTLTVNDHEFGAKLILDGVTIPARAATAANGLLDLADAHNQIFNHGNTGPFICRQLIQRMVTANPSPGYVYRVSQAFANNGHGTRGDMKAVVKAILLDYEARAAYNTVAEPNKFPNSPVYTQGFGKLREPLLRVSAMARAFRPSSFGGQYRIPGTDPELLQTVARPPTVFNFYEPNYSHPGKLATEGLFSPEFQILSEISIVTAANFMENATRNALKGGDVRLDYSVEQAIASNPTALVDRLNLLLMYGQMSATMKSTIVTHVTSLSAANPLERVRAAVHLIVSSSEFASQR